MPPVPAVRGDKLVMALERRLRSRSVLVLRRRAHRQGNRRPDHRQRRMGRQDQAHGRPGQARGRAQPGWHPQAGKDLQTGPQPGQDQLAGGGDVVGAAGQDLRCPQRGAVRGDDALDQAGVLVRLTGMPFVDLRPFPAGFPARAAVGGDQRAVQDDAGDPLPSGLFKVLLERRGLPGEDLDAFVLVPVGGGLRDAEALAEPAQVRLVPEPGEDELRLLPAGQGRASRSWCRARPGASSGGPKP